MSTLTAPRPQFTPVVGRNHVRRGTGRPWRLRHVPRPLMLLLLVAMVLGVLLSGLVGDSDADVPGPQAQTVVVGHGDTVWDLAREHVPAGMTVQDYAWLVVEHNDVTATALQPGTVLVLPGG